MVEKTRRLALVGSVVTCVVLALSLAACGAAKDNRPNRHRSNRRS